MIDTLFGTNSKKSYPPPQIKFMGFYYSSSDNYIEKTKLFNELSVL